VGSLETRGDGVEETLMLGRAGGQLIGGDDCRLGLRGGQLAGRLCRRCSWAK